jgi:hypothetical protein
MKAPFAHVSRVISTTHVVLLGQSAGSVRGRTMEDHDACFLYANQELPPARVRCVEIRASGKVSGGDGAFDGWQCMWNPLFRRTWSKAPLRACSGVSMKERMSG